jgi:hypothetical protein
MIRIEDRAFQPGIQRFRELKEGVWFIRVKATANFVYRKSIDEDSILFTDGMDAPTIALVPLEEEVIEVRVACEVKLTLWEMTE